MLKNKYTDLEYYKDGKFENNKQIVNHFERLKKCKLKMFLDFVFTSKNAPKHKLPTIKPTFNDIPEDFAMYWLGHSSVIIELNGKRIIIDPVFKNAAPVPFVIKRYQESIITRQELPKIDYVFITHNHYDHLEKNTVKLLNNSHFIVPLGISKILKKWGINENNITELSWNEEFEDESLKIISLPSVHFSGRGLKDNNKTLWSAFVIKSKNKTIFWSGDTGYDEKLLEVYKKYKPFDIIALEIDAWNNAWPDVHLFPDQVIEITKELQPKYLLPIHWGVFDLAIHPWNESIELVYGKAKENNISLLTQKIGEKINDNNLPSEVWWK